MGEDTVGRYHFFKAKRPSFILYFGGRGELYFTKHSTNNSMATRQSSLKDPKKGCQGNNANAIKVHRVKSLAFEIIILLIDRSQQL